LPVADAGESIPFADVIEEVLILPEQGDSVRNRIVRAAQAIGAEPNVAFEVRSIPAMKSLILRGTGSGILPFAAVLSEVREGRLLARRVTAPALRRTLYLAVRTGTASPRNAVALRALVRGSLRELVVTLGPLAHPLAGAE
jgi:LysR family nitrogen assimilation transcriptional regulator